MLIQKYVRQIALLASLSANINLLCSEAPKIFWYQQPFIFIYAFMVRMVPQSLLTKKAPQIDTTKAANQVTGEAAFTAKDWNDWIELCAKIPHFRDLNAQYPLVEKVDKETEKTYAVNFQKQCETIQKITGLQWSFVNRVFTAYKKQADNSALTDSNAWIKKEALAKNFEKSSTPEFSPFVMGFKLPEKARTHFLPDQHAAIHSSIGFLKNLQKDGILDANFKIVDPNDYIIGLGDYVDGGTAGIETLITFLMLKIQNPKNVILVRGNHEDSSLNIDYFQKELEHKFPQQITRKLVEKTKKMELTEEAKNNLDSIARVCDTMPVAVAIGHNNKDKTVTSYIVGSHAGLDTRHNLSDLFSALRSKKDHEVVYERYPINLPRKDSGNAAALEILKADAYVAQSEYYTKGCKDHKGIDYEQAYIIDDNSTVTHRFNAFHEQCSYGKPLMNAMFKDLRYVEKPSLFGRLFGAKTYTAYVHGVVRGHQHAYYDYPKYPTMMDSLFAHKGCWQAWNPAQSKTAFQLTVPQDSFYTLLVASDNEYGEPIPSKKYPGVTFDTMVRVLPRDMDKTTGWELTKINIEGHKKKIAGQS